MAVQLRDGFPESASAHHAAHVVRTDIIRNCVGWEDVCDAHPKADECACEEVGEDLPTYHDTTQASASLVGTPGLSEMLL